MLPTEEDKLGYLHNSLASAELLILPKALNLITGSEYTELVRREGDMIQSVEAFKMSIILQIKKLRTPQSDEEETPDSLDKTVLLRLCTNREMEKVERFMVKMHELGWLRLTDRRQIHARISNVEWYPVTEGTERFCWTSPVAKLRAFRAQMNFTNRGLIPEHFCHENGREINPKSLNSGGSERDREKHTRPVDELARELLH